MVADALSRQGGQQINLATTNSEMQKIPSAINQFGNQFEITKSDHNSIVTKTIFQKYINHEIKFMTLVELISYLKLTISNKQINTIYSTKETSQMIEKPIRDAFIN